MFDHEVLSRLQFALTAIFHMIFPVLTIGLSILLVFTEAMWLKTKEAVYYQHCRFWGTLFLLNFAIGVATGIPMEFQFSTNWSHFSMAGGDVFGHLLGFEASISFMLEASFLGVMLFGWRHVSSTVHLFATAMVSFGAFLSAFWIMSANSWMQTPTGGFMNGEGKFEVADHMSSIFNPDAIWGASHMIAAAVEVSLFVVGAVSAWYMLKNRHTAFFLKSFKIALIAAIIITPLQVYLGDGSGREVYFNQPTKLAAIEAHWDTNNQGESAPFHIMAWPLPDQEKNIWEINLPYGLSLITTHSLDGTVMGMKEFPKEDRPPIAAPFFAFRLMVGLGFAFFLLMLWTVWAWRRGKLTTEEIGRQKGLLYSWIVAAPLSYLAVELGWIVREVGRQPWTMFGMVRTSASASPLPPATVASSLITFIVFYLLLLFVFLLFAGRLIKRGPNFETPPEK